MPRIRSRLSHGLLGAVISTALLLFVGCGPDSSGEGVDKEITDQLSLATVSWALRATSQLEECDGAKAEDFLFASSLDLSATMPSEVWDKCEAIYACAPGTKRLLHEYLTGGAVFRIGVVDLSPIAGKTKIGNDLQGLYLSGRDIVYLNSHLTSPLSTCSILIHELVHRFDANLSAGRQQNFGTEYRAYWQQHLFIQELVLERGGLGKALRDIICKRNTKILSRDVARVPPIWSRQQIIDDVAFRYKYVPDSTISESLGELPAAGQHLCQL